MQAYVARLFGNNLVIAYDSSTSGLTNSSVIPSIYNPSSSTSATATGIGGSSNPLYISHQGGGGGTTLFYDDSANKQNNDPPNYDIKKGWSGTVKLPDGSEIVIDVSGNYRILDDNAQVVYKANRNRDFNRFVNASDLLEEFINQCGELGVKQDQFLSIPIEVFINWLIIRAAEADGDSVPNGIQSIEHHPSLPRDIQPKCLYCGRYIDKRKARAGINFCDSQHMDEYVNKLGLE